MMNFDGGAVAKEFEAAFGKSIADLTPLQIMWLIKVSKHVRGRCRSNAALKNYLSRNFTGHIFSEETRQGRRGPYQALVIASRQKPEEKVTDSDTDE